jgi:cytoskeletal protein CcmA (bactofilin family)
MQTQEIQHDRGQRVLNGSSEVSDGMRKIIDRAEPRESAGHRREVSVIGADIVVTGNIEASVDLHIEGKVVGDVRCATLILGENSSVNGHIYAARVKVSGTVDGAIATKDLAVEATARVTGEISYERLRVANGGLIEGQVTRKEPVITADERSRPKLVEAREPLLEALEKIVVE